MIPKEIINTIKFKNKQKDMDSLATHLDKTGLTHIEETQQEGEDDIDEGTPQSVKRKEWSPNTNKIKTGSPLKQKPIKYKDPLEVLQSPLERLKSANEGYNNEEMKEMNFTQSLRSDRNYEDIDVFLEDNDAFEEDDNDNVFDIETPKIGTEPDKSIKEKYIFEDVASPPKRRVTAYHRRDSRIGMLIGKACKFEEFLKLI